MANIKPENTQIVQYLRKCFSSLGFIPNQLLSGRLLGGLAMFLFNFSTSFLFLLYGADTFWEYTNSIFTSLATGVILILFIILIFQVWRIFEVLDLGQIIYDGSK